MRKKLIFGLVTVWLLAFLFSSLAMAQTRSDKIHPDVAKLLAMKAAPEGVVFDIETLSPNALTEVAPYVRDQIQLIKQKFPDVDIAVVSHGVEEFALEKKAEKQNAELHSIFNQLVDDSGVSVHVCGAVGGLKQLTQDDFPDFVSYSASGMAQLNDYKALGYFVIAIHQLTDSQRKDLFEHKDKYIK